jgi:hypothetical protein
VLFLLRRAMRIIARLGRTLSGQRHIALEPAFPSFWEICRSGDSAFPLKGGPTSFVHRKG